MLSPLQRAAFIASKIVSTVSSACFWVSWRFATRMAIRSLFSIVFAPRNRARIGKTFDGCERYCTCRASSKCLNEGNCKRFFAYISLPRTHRGKGWRCRFLHRFALLALEEGIQRFSEDGLGGALRLGEGAGDSLGERIGLLRGKSERGARGGPNLRQRDVGRIASREPAALLRFD